VQCPLREKIVQFKQGVEAKGGGPGRTNCAVSRGKGD